MNRWASVVRTLREAPKTSISGEIGECELCYHICMPAHWWCSADRLSDIARALKTAWLNSDTLHSLQPSPMRVLARAPEWQRPIDGFFQHESVCPEPSMNIDGEIGECELCYHIRMLAHWWCSADRQTVKKKKKKKKVKFSDEELRGWPASLRTGAPSLQSAQLQDDAHSAAHIENADGWQPIHFACQHGHLEVTAQSRAMDALSAANKVLTVLKLAAKQDNLDRVPVRFIDVVHHMREFEKLHAEAESASSSEEIVIKVYIYRSGPAFDWS